MKSHYLFALALCCLVILTGGCGSGMKQLTGKVTFEDGSPVTLGSVIFVQGSFQSRGDIRPDGTYTVGTNAAKDGIPPGEYRVYITGVMEERGMGADGMPNYVSLIDEKYTSPETSGLTYTAGTSPFNITLERAK